MGSAWSAKQRGARPKASPGHSLEPATLNPLYAVPPRAVPEKAPLPRVTRVTRVCGRSSGLNENTRSALATASLERDVCVTSAKPHPAPPVPSPHPAPPQERSLRPPRSAPRGRGERRPRGRGLLVTCAHQRTQAQPHAAGRGRAISSKILSWGVTARTAKNVVQC